MLLRPDANLATRDPGVPGLALVLDPDRLAGQLSTRLGVDIEHCTIQYVRYKPGTSCLVRASIKVGGGSHDLHVTAYRLQDGDKCRKALALATAPSRLGPPSVMLDDHCLATFFPNDSTARALGKLASDATCREMLVRVFADRPALHHAGWSLLAYKPERRAAIRLDVDGRPAAVLKLYGDDRFDVARANAKAFRSTGSLRVAARIGRSGGLHALGLEWIHGTELTLGLCGADARAAVSLAAAALAELHRGTVASRGRADALSESLVSTAHAVAMLRPELCDAVTRVAMTLAEMIGPIAPTAAIHGDFYAKQVLVQPGSAAILDLDDAQPGEPEQDLGNLLGHLDWDARIGRVSAEAVRVAEEHFVDEYERAGGQVDRERVRLYRAIGLFRLAARPFRDRLPDWPERIQEVIASVAAMIPRPVEVSR